jgi:hypothetical protein
LEWERELEERSEELAAQNAKKQKIKEKNDRHRAGQMSDYAESKLLAASAEAAIS